MAYRKRKPIPEPTDLGSLLSILPELEIPRARQEELNNISNFYEGSKAALSWKNFPPPDGSKELCSQYEEHRRNLLLVNRVKTVARTWTSILNGDVTRTVHDCPNKSLVEDYVTGYEFAEAMGAFKRSSVLYGTQVAVPVFDPDTKEISVWLPYPARTIIITSKTNIRKVLAVVEIHDDWCQFISLWGEGVVTDKGEATVSPREYDHLPVSIGYGYSRIHERQIYGLSMCSEAVNYSIQETNCAFNISLLARQQTRDILSIIGDLTKISQNINNDDVDVGLNEDGTLVLPENFQAAFLKPDPKITQSIDVGKYYQSLFASVSAIPIDIIAPDQVTNPSNESARIRSTSLLAEAKDIVPRWLATELDFVYSLIYVIDYHLSDESPETSWVDIKSRSNVEVKNQFKILPVSPNELTQNSIALVAAGLQRRRDAIRENNKHLSEAEIDEMIAEYAEKLASGENPHVVEQFSLKSSKEALTPEQKAVLENED